MVVTSHVEVFVEGLNVPGLGRATPGWDLGRAGRALVRPHRREALRSIGKLPRLADAHRKTVEQAVRDPT